MNQLECQADGRQEIRLEFQQLNQQKIQQSKYLLCQLRVQHMIRQEDQRKGLRQNQQEGRQDGQLENHLKNQLKIQREDRQRTQRQIQLVNQLLSYPVIYPFIKTDFVYHEALNQELLLEPKQKYNIETAPTPKNPFTINQTPPVYSRKEVAGYTSLIPKCQMAKEE
mmetsp:Transcript_9790/g.12123  ORF Transcript_9790/g.12123 Transcript_9790/m.12123 type:complete len:167 (+) Transcript_9790:1141-1641(+)